MSDVYDEYRAKLADLRTEVAARKGAAASIQEQLDSVNAQMEYLRRKQVELVAAKSKALGGQSYIDLKKHIAALSKLLAGK